VHPLVIIVILNWNSHEETAAAVASVRKLDYPSYRIVLIDNGSKPESFQAIGKLADEHTELIRSEVNLGYAGGCNLGIDLALRMNAGYVWLLNSDAVTEPGTLSSLVRRAEADSSIALVSPLIASLQNPLELQNAGGRFNPEVPAYTLNKQIGTAMEWSLKYPDQIVLLGTALLVRVAALRRIGGFDPNLFAYWEDTDLSLRALKAGYRNVIDFESKIYHATDHPESRIAKPYYWYYMARNEILFWKKHSSRRKKLHTLWWAYRTQLGFLRKNRDKEVLRRAILAGLWDGWLNRTGAWKPDRNMPRVLARVIESHSSTV